MYVCVYTYIYNTYINNMIYICIYYYIYIYVYVIYIALLSVERYDTCVPCVDCDSSLLWDSDWARIPHPLLLSPLRISSTLLSTTTSIDVDHYIILYPSIHLSMTIIYIHHYIYHYMHHYIPFKIGIFPYGGFLKCGTPIAGWYWKIPSINGWELGIPPWRRKPPNV